MSSDSISSPHSEVWCFNDETHCRQQHYSTHRELRLYQQREQRTHLPERRELLLLEDITLVIFHLNLRAQSPQFSDSVLMSDWKERLDSCKQERNRSVGARLAHLFHNVTNWQKTPVRGKNVTLFSSTETNDYFCQWWTFQHCCEGRYLITCSAVFFQHLLNMSVHSHIVSHYKKNAFARKDELQNLKKNCIHIFIHTLHYILGFINSYNVCVGHKPTKAGWEIFYCFLTLQTYYKLFDQILSSNFSNQVQIKYFSFTALVRTCDFIWLYSRFHSECRKNLKM